MTDNEQDKGIHGMSEESGKSEIDFSKKTIKESLLLIGANWLNAQNFNNLLLLAIIGLIAYGGRYAITIAIPDHLKTIQQGYEKIEAAGSMERAKMEEAHSKERKEAIETYDKWFERFISTKTTKVGEE